MLEQVENRLRDSVFLVASSAWREMRATFWEGNVLCRATAATAGQNRRSNQPPRSPLIADDGKMERVGHAIPARGGREAEERNEHAGIKPSLSESPVNLVARVKRLIDSSPPPPPMIAAPLSLQYTPAPGSLN